MGLDSGPFQDITAVESGEDIYLVAPNFESFIYNEITDGWDDLNITNQPSVSMVTAIARDYDNGFIYAVDSITFDIYRLDLGTANWSFVQTDPFGGTVFNWVIASDVIDDGSGRFWICKLDSPLAWYTLVPGGAPIFVSNQAAGWASGNGISHSHSVWDQVNQRLVILWRKFPTPLRHFAGSVELDGSTGEVFTMPSVYNNNTLSGGALSVDQVSGDIWLNESQNLFSGGDGKSYICSYSVSAGFTEEFNLTDAGLSNAFRAIFNAERSQFLGTITNTVRAFDKDASTYNQIGINLLPTTSSNSISG